MHLQTVVFWVLQILWRFLANRLPFPHWIGLALRSATVKVFQGERLMAKNNHLPLGDGSNMAHEFAVPDLDEFDHDRTEGDMS